MCKPRGEWVKPACEEAIGSERKEESSVRNSSRKSGGRL
jgi:hypothetical protein